MAGEMRKILNFSPKPVVSHRVSQCEVWLASGLPHRILNCGSLFKPSNKRKYKDEANIRVSTTFQKNKINYIKVEIFFKQIKKKLRY